MSKRGSWREIRAERMKNPEAGEAYENAAISFALAEQVRKIREDKGMSQAELALEMGTTQSAVARLEGGGTSPTIPTLTKLADALGVELVLGFNDPGGRAGAKATTSLTAGASRLQRAAAKKTSTKTTARSVAGKKGARSGSQKAAARRRSS